MNTSALTFSAVLVAGLALAGCSSSASPSPSTSPSTSPSISASSPTAPMSLASVDPANAKFCQDIQILMTESTKSNSVDPTAQAAVIADAPADLKDSLPDYLSAFGTYLQTKDETIAQQPAIMETSAKLTRTCG